MDPSWLEKLRALRRARGISLRALARRAGISQAALSAIEQGRSSPTLATLHKILLALDSDYQHFFSSSTESTRGPVFPAKSMQAITDRHRRYVLAFPPNRLHRFELLCETIAPTEDDPEWETHPCDLGGIVLAGGPAWLEIDGQGKHRMCKGDAFYIPAGCRHRARNVGRRPLRLITVAAPPRY